MHESFDSGLPLWRHSRNQLLPSSMLTSVLTNSLQGRLETGFQHTPFTEGQAVGGLGNSKLGATAQDGDSLWVLLSQVLGEGARGLGLPILLAGAHPALSWPCRCFSSIGRSGGMQVVSLGPSCLQRGPGIVLHELMHVLGFWHEHSRADRDRYIRVNWNEILPGKPAHAWWGRWRRGGPVRRRRQAWPAPKELPGHLGKVFHLPCYLPVSHGEGGIPAFLQDMENDPDAAALGPEASVPPTVTLN